MFYLRENKILSLLKDIVILSYFKETDKGWKDRVREREKDFWSSMYERHTSTYELCMLHAKFRQIIEQKVTVSFSMRSILCTLKPCLPAFLPVLLSGYMCIYLFVCLFIPVLWKRRKREQNKIMAEMPCYRSRKTNNNSDNYLVRTPTEEAKTLTEK